MTARTSAVTLTPLLGFPEVRRGDDLVDLVLKALQDNRIELDDGDILVVSSKIASKAMGLSAPLAERDDVVVAQTVRVVAERMTPLGITSIVETVAGPVMAAAGVDASNTADASIVLVLPDDPDAVAGEIRGGVTAGWESSSATPQGGRGGSARRTLPWEPPASRSSMTCGVRQTPTGGSSG